MEKIEISFTNHAKKRIRQRGANPELIKAYLENKRIPISQRGKNLEIFIPFGRLVGILEKNTFIVKTFLYPFRSKSDFHRYGKKSPRGFDLYCTKVILNQLSKPRKTLTKNVKETAIITRDIGTTKLREYQND